jgi:hypothetical protein
MRPAFRWSTARGKTRLPDTSANVVPVVLVVPVMPVALIAPGHAQAPPGPPPGATMPDRADATPESGNAPRSIRDLPLRSGRGSLRLTALPATPTLSAPSGAIAFGNMEWCIDAGARVDPLTFELDMIYPVLASRVAVTAAVEQPAIAPAPATPGLSRLIPRCGPNRIGDASTVDSACHPAASAAMAGTREREVTCSANEGRLSCPGAPR